MNVAKLKIAELKKALKERGLAITGNKSELAARLKEALSAEGSDTSFQDDDIEAKESELLGEEEDEEDVEETAELDTKLLDTTPATPAMKPKKIIINREAAASAQLAAEEAVAQEVAAKAAPPEDASTTEAVALPEAAPPSKKIRLTAVTEMDRLLMRSQKNEATMENIKILTAEERKAARLAKFGAAADSADGGGDVKKPAAVTVKGGADLEVLKKRADRFGEITSGKVKTLEERERIAKRKERFGIVSADEAKAQRAARFDTGRALITAPGTDASLEEKKRQRAARFGTS